MKIEKYAEFLKISKRSYYDWRKTYPYVCFLLESIFQTDNELFLYNEFNLLPFSCASEKIYNYDVNPTSYLEKDLVAELLNIKPHSLHHWKKKNIDLFDFISKAFSNNERLQEFITLSKSINKLSISWKEKIKSLKKYDFFESYNEERIKVAVNVLNQISPVASMDVLEIFRRSLRNEKKDIIDFNIGEYCLSLIPLNLNIEIKQVAPTHKISKVSLLTHEKFNSFDIEEFTDLAQRIQAIKQEELELLYRIKTSDLYLYSIYNFDFELFNKLLLIDGGWRVLYNIIEQYKEDEFLDKEKWGLDLDFNEESLLLMIFIYNNYIWTPNFKRYLSNVKGLSYRQTDISEKLIP